MSNKLPPLDLKEDNEKYQAFNEKTEIKFNKCKHDPQLISGNEIKCKKCGNGWTGDNILKLFSLLQSSS